MGAKLAQCLIVVLALTVSVVAQDGAVPENAVPNRKPAVVGSQVADSAVSGAEVREAELREQLKSQWELFRGGIATVEAEFSVCNLFFRSKELPKIEANYKRPEFPEPTLTGEELVALIDRLDLVNHPENRDLFCEQALAGQPAFSQPWIDSWRYLQKGQLLRDEYAGRAYVLDATNFVDIQPGSHQMRVNVRGRYAMRHYMLSDLLPLTNDPLAVADTWRIIEHPEADYFEMRPPGVDDGTYAIIDTATNVPLLWRMVDNGVVVGDLIARNVVTLPSGIPFPFLSARATYYKGQLTQLHLQIIKTVELNHPLEDAVFKVQAIPGDMLIDQRGELVRPVKVDQPIDDVVAFLDAQGSSFDATAAPASATGRVSSPLQVILFLNGLVLLVVGVFLWRRSRDPKHVLDP